MSGTKTIINASAHAIEVTLVGRRGSDPNSDLRAVTVNIPAGGTARDVRYGDDQNPYLNALSITTVDSSAKAVNNLRATQTGGTGTLDNRLNSFSVFKIVADPDQATFSLTSD